MDTGGRKRRINLMNTNYQNRLISEYLWRHHKSDHLSSFISAHDVESELERIGFVLPEGGYVVLQLNGQTVSVSSVSSFSDLAVINREAVLISYKELEGYFHEAHSPQCELY